MLECLAESLLDIDTSALDCVQANLAAAANAAHRTPDHDALGAWLRFRPRAAQPEDLTDDPGLVTIEPTLDERLTAADRLLGLWHTTPRQCIGPQELIDRLSENWELVVADAFELPWVPYFGHTHTSHSFLLRKTECAIELTDAYSNQTPWGKAVPTTWTLTQPMIEALLPDGPCTVVTLRGGRIGPLNPYAEIRGTIDDLARARYDGRIDGYIGAYADHPDQVVALTKFTVETWLLARQRMAHSRWLSRFAPANAARLHAERWAEAAEATYVAMRRVTRGRPVPERVVSRIGDLLGRDYAVIRDCALAV